MYNFLNLDFSIKFPTPKSPKLQFISCIKLSTASHFQVPPVSMLSPSSSPFSAFVPKSLAHQRTTSSQIQSNYRNRTSTRLGTESDGDTARHDNGALCSGSGVCKYMYKTRSFHLRTTIGLLVDFSIYSQCLSPGAVPSFLAWCHT